MSQKKIEKLEVKMTVSQISSIKVLQFIYLFSFIGTYLLLGFEL